MTLCIPQQAPEVDRGDATAFEQPMPVRVELAYVEIGRLRTHGSFARAASDQAVLVETTWQGCLQKVRVPRPLVNRRKLTPRSHVDAEVDRIDRELPSTGSRRDEQVPGTAP